MSRISLTATVHVRRTTQESVAYSSFLRYQGCRLVGKVRLLRIEGSVLRWLVVYSPRQIEAAELFHRSSEVAELVGWPLRPIESIDRL